MLETHPSTPPPTIGTQLNLGHRLSGTSLLHIRNKDTYQWVRLPTFTKPPLLYSISNGIYERFRNVPEVRTWNRSKNHLPKVQTFDRVEVFSSTEKLTQPVGVGGLPGRSYRKPPSLTRHEEIRRKDRTDTPTVRDNGWRCR